MVRVLHIVRRFGPVGGMERYVWRLTHELASLGVKVEVLCETIEQAPIAQIVVHTVERSHQRRRWRAMHDFRLACAAFWVGYGNSGDVIVHSHERCLFHHVTTFHGPPIGQFSRVVPWWKRWQPRLKAWAQFEKEELLGRQVSAIVPVSSAIADTLLKTYPASLKQMKEPGWPGVDKPKSVCPNSKGFKVLFVGREWKRKGLDVAIEAFSIVREKWPEASLDVYGVKASDLPRSLKKISASVTFHGWQTSVPYERYDVLIHPARNEPFGMIVPEARASGLSVIVSNRVGASELPLSHVRVLDVSATVGSWVQAICDTFAAERPIPEICWSWQDLAKWHLLDLYSHFRFDD